MTTELDIISHLPSYNWSLEALWYIDGLSLLLEWNGNDSAYAFPGFGWISIHFSYPVSWRYIDISQSKSHPPDDKGSPIFEVASEEFVKPALGDITTAKKPTESGCFYPYRIVAWDDILDVASNSKPSIRLISNPPNVLNWWQNAPEEVR